MLGLASRDFRLLIVFAIAILTMPIWMAPLHGNVEFYKLTAIFGIFAIGFNLLFGLTGYLSFGHAALFGVGSVAGFWSLKLITMSAYPAILVGGAAGALLALVMGFLCLRRSGIYFSILTLAFTIMVYEFANRQSRLTGGDDSLSITGSRIEAQVWSPAQGMFVPDRDENGASRMVWESPMVIDRLLGHEDATPKVNFGILMEKPTDDEEAAPEYRAISLRRDSDLLKLEYDLQLVDAKSGGFFNRVIGFLQHGKIHYQVFPFFACLLLILAFYISIRVTRSPFGLMLRAVKTNQTRMGYTGLQPKRYTLAAFVISGAYAGVAGSLMALSTNGSTALRMVWGTSGEVVIMTILGGVGSLVGPVLGAGVVEYLKDVLTQINFTGDGIFVFIGNMFFGQTWLLTVGLVFMLVVIFLPGGLIGLPKKIMALVRREGKGDKS